MSLEKKFFIITETCDCNDEQTDGYASFRRFRCMNCRDKGFTSKQINLAELKALLDGYGSGS